MTDEEKAREIVNSHIGEFGGNDESYAQLTQAILSALTSARQSEREECAKIADEEADFPGDPSRMSDVEYGNWEGSRSAGTRIASSIRSRSGTDTGAPEVQAAISGPKID